MLVKEARDIAQQWVEAKASIMPGFIGAFIFGSVNWMRDDEPLPPTSDLDIRVVLDANEVPSGFQKFVYDGVLLEISYRQLGDIQSPEAVLSDYPTAAHFTRPCIVADVTGHLRQIQAVVAKEFARRKWVQARVEAAKSWQLNSLDLFLHKSDPFHEQVFAWVYVTAIFCHMILVADLKNPTVRKMMVAAHEVLARYDQLVFHESVLEILGTASLSQQHVEQLFENLVEVFEAAKAVRKTDFFGSSAISEEGQPTALGGIEELINLGYPREASFWLIIIHSWCQKILHNDASSDMQARFMPAYEHLLNSLGISSLVDIYQRIEQVKALRPQATAVTEYIMARNPDIID
jgi:hypothetical protein